MTPLEYCCCGVQQYKLTDCLWDSRPSGFSHSVEQANKQRSKATGTTADSNSKGSVKKVSIGHAAFPTDKFQPIFPTDQQIKETYGMGVEEDGGTTKSDESGTVSSRWCLCCYCCSTVLQKFVRGSTRRTRPRRSPLL